MCSRHVFVYTCGVSRDIIWVVASGISPAFGLTVVKANQRTAAEQQRGHQSEKQHYVKSNLLLGGPANCVPLQRCFVILPIKFASVNPNGWKHPFVKLEMALPGMKADNKSQQEGGFFYRTGLSSKQQTHSGLFSVWKQSTHCLDYSILGVIKPAIHKTSMLNKPVCTG